MCVEVFTEEEELAMSAGTVERQRRQQRPPPDVTVSGGDCENRPWTRMALNNLHANLVAFYLEYHVRHVL